MSVFIGGAWPYANGSLHIGHLAALLPGDILARYYRLKGEDVLYMSGSDCNGTPIEIRANRDGIKIKDIADRYHQEFHESFQKLGFTFDHFGRTDSEIHHREVQKIFNKLLDNGYLYEKRTEETFCLECDRFLPDRFVEGNCPECGEGARGDQCDECGSILNPADLRERSCKLCGTAPVLKQTLHLYLKLSDLQAELAEYLDAHRDKWSENAIQLTERYLREGLRDRAATRDIGSGVDVPLEGFSHKKIYVWIEAVCGYLTGSMARTGINELHGGKFWAGNATSYYVHGKDNIPFHTIIWPAILKGIGIEKLPERVISSEYLTLEKRKISTSRNWAVWLPDILKNYHPDTLRYYCSVNNPDKKDTDFSWREFIYKHNTELLGGLGNYIRRTAEFYRKEFGEGAIVKKIDPVVKAKLEDAFLETGELLEKGECRKAARTAFEVVRWSNKYFDSQEPWRVIKQSRTEGRIILETCLYIGANLATLLSPFIPFTAGKIREVFHLKGEPSWSICELPVKMNISQAEPLFTRIPTENIEIERAKLG
ncbi:methionine--tRNA ligase [Bacillus sp. AK031]